METIEEAFIGSVPAADDGDLPEQPEGGPCDRAIGRPGRARVFVADPGQPRGDALAPSPSQDHLLPFSSFSRFSRSKGPSVSFTRFSTLWEGLGENLSSLPASSLSPLLRLLMELTAFKCPSPSPVP